MLIYSYKLEKYILEHFFPKILLVPNSYVIKGSFRRKIPYITDIDIVNKVYPSINKTNIYSKIIELIERAYSDNDIIVVQITCGTDDRFKVTNANNDEIERIRQLLTTEEQMELDKIIKEYANDNEKKTFFINELIWPLYKLRWTPYQVLNNSMELRGSHRVSFEEIVATSPTILIQYYLKIGTHLLGVDVVIQYADIVQEKKVYEDAANYYLKLSNYKKEYYYMLFPLKNYFKNEKSGTFTELEDIIEKKMGLYKQLMVRIDAYRILYITNNLNMQIAKNIIVNLIRDVSKLPNFESNIITKMQEILDGPIGSLRSSDVPHPNEHSSSGDFQSKIENWYVLLGSLYDEINGAASLAAKKYFYDYLNMIPEPQRKNYCLEFASEVRHAVKNKVVQYMGMFF